MPQSATCNFTARIARLFRGRGTEEVRGPRGQNNVGFSMGCNATLLAPGLGPDKIPQQFSSVSVSIISGQLHPCQHGYTHNSPRTIDVMTGTSLYQFYVMTPKLSPPEFSMQWPTPFTQIRLSKLNFLEAPRIT